RLGFRAIDEERFLLRTNRAVLFGLAMIALAITLAAYLVTSVVLRAPDWAALVAAAIAGWYVAWWFGLPQLALRKDHGHTVRRDHDTLERDGERARERLAKGAVGEVEPADQPVAAADHRGVDGHPPRSLARAQPDAAGHAKW